MGCIISKGRIEACHFCFTAILGNSAALDSATANEIMEALLKLNRAMKTIILVTHDINMANKMGRIVHIADGIRRINALDWLLGR